MTVICESNFCKEFPLVISERLGEPIGEDNFVFTTGYTVDRDISSFNISIGNEYEVYGLLIYNGQIRFLIQDDSGMPVLCPAELFRIANTHIYWDWEISQYIIENKVLMIVGYPAMTGEYQSIVDLVNREKNATAEFLDYKKHYLAYKDVMEWY